MTELELRTEVLALASMYLGCRTGDTSERIIIDAYNSYFKGHYPRNYVLKYTDSWCQAFVEGVAIMSNLADIFPSECGCQEALNLAKSMGICQARTYIPEPADVVYFDNNGDGWSDHTGYVKLVKDGKLYTIEGNAMGGTCCEKSYDVNDKRIFAYVTPDYERKADFVPDKPDYATDYDDGKVGHYSATTGLYIRQKPSGLSKAVGVIPKNNVIFANGWYSKTGSTEWLYVDYNGTCGYSSGRYLTKL